MGGGSYSYYNASMRSHSLRSSSVSREEIFRNRCMNEEMDIKGKTRESCDSEEHPESFPVIIALDVTGSMGMVPEKLVKEGFPEIMKKLMDEGIDNPQVCFVGIGDFTCDNAPIQVGQFESSDELTEKWLTSLFLEGGGGGNGFETYSVAYYFAARHTKTDSFDKRGKKGVLITIGDDCCNKVIPQKVGEELFGTCENDVPTSEILSEALQKWDVYHINLKDYLGSTSAVINSWKDLLGENVITTENGDGNDIPSIISGLVLRSFNGDSNKKKQSNVIDDED
jgi:hypothetical protein